jgi:glycosyltransferase involved in cell wall biosynthesis
MKDEAANIARALSSVPQGSAILAIDAESQDASVSIAREHGAQVMVRPWAGFVEARKFAVGRVTTPWTFMLDADEALDAHLRAALESLEPGAGIDGFAVRRATFFCGRAMRHGAWGSDAPLRFFRTGRAQLSAKPVAGGAAELHERWTVQTAVETACGSLLHYSYPTIAAYCAKFRRYTSLEAAGIRGSLFALAAAAFLALLRVPHALVVRSGWRDGWRGAFVALGSAAYPVVVSWKALAPSFRWQALRR